MNSAVDWPIRWQSLRMREGIRQGCINRRTMFESTRLYRRRRSVPKICLSWFLRRPIFIGSVLR